MSNFIFFLCCALACVCFPLVVGILVGEHGKNTPKLIGVFAVCYTLILLLEGLI